MNDIENGTKRRYGIIWIVIVVIACILVLGFVQHSSAYIELHQGDDVYIGETVDISLVGSWPDFALAWCNSHSSTCTSPEQIVYLTGNLHKYYINPDIFRAGDYYRWDGKWNRGENAFAMRVKAGERPVNTTTVINGTESSPVIIKRSEGPYSFLIARGDTPTVTGYFGRRDPATFWIFAPTIDGMDIDMTEDNMNYSHKISFNESYALAVGSYKGYIQFVGDNKMQDVFVNKDKQLDTIFDDELIPDVNIEIFDKAKSKERFDALVKSLPYSDDTLVNITIDVSEPTITITNVEQDDEKLWLSGVTTWEDGTVLNIALDPDNYKLKTDIERHSWTTETHRGIETTRTFNTALKLNKDELYVGVHEIKMSAIQNNIKIDSYYTFRISDVYVMPTPTPQITRKMLDVNWEPIPTPTTQQPMNPVTISPTISVVAPIVSETVSVSPTDTITPNRTEALPVAKETIPTIPLPVILPILSLGILAWIKKFKGI